VTLAAYRVMVEVPFEVVSPPELVGQLRVPGEWMVAAAARSRGSG